MVIGLRRHQDVGDLHFVAFSSYQRHAYLGLPAVKDLFEDALERIRGRYGLEVVGYVVMPEHVHLLLSEPQRESSSDRGAPLRPKAALGGRPASSVPVQLSLRDMVGFLGIAPGVETPGYFQNVLRTLGAAQLSPSAALRAGSTGHGWVSRHRTRR